MSKLKDVVHKPELVFVCIASFLGLLSAILLPILAAPDENQHFQVSYAIFSADKHASGDLVLNESMILSAVRDGDYKEYYTEKTSASQDDIAINTGSLVFDGKTRASIYDIMHLPQAIGILVGKLIYPSLGVMVLMGRLFTLALYVSALYVIIKKVRHGKWVFVFVASLPIMIQQAASLSYDPINALAIFTWVAFIVNLVTQHVKITRAQVITGVFLVVFLLLSKSNNLLLLMLLFAIPKERIIETRVIMRIRSNKHWKVIKYASLVVSAALICAGIYLLSVKLLAGHEFHPNRLIHVLLNTFIWGDLALIDVSTIGILGQFSNFYYHLPVWVVVTAFAVLLIIMLCEKLPTVSKKFAVISGLLFFGSILLITVGMYYGWAMRPERLGSNAEIADGIQGRYFTPLLILLFPLLAYAQKYVKIVTRTKTFIPILSTSTSLILLVLYLVQTWHFFWQ